MKKGLPEVPTSLNNIFSLYYMSSLLNFLLRILSCATTMYLQFLLSFLLCLRLQIKKLIFNIPNIST